MTQQILILTDYKGFFGSKQKSPIYRGGMDLTRIITIFQQYGYQTVIKKFSEIDIQEIIRTKPIILYTSSEDESDRYKSYIEDIILALESTGVPAIPKFTYLRAHNNKVFMELLRNISNFDDIHTIHSEYYGTIEELQSKASHMEFPVVIKTFGGAMSRGVAKANNKEELISAAKKFSRSSAMKHNIKEILRKVKYKQSYVRESFHRNKFIIQNMIQGLSNDWKVLVYGNRVYILYRGVRENDFRASGSGKFIFDENIPEGILDFAWKIQNFFDVPHISLDIGFDGKQFHLIEFQFLHFGTTTLEKAPHYFEKRNGKWDIIREKSNLEDVYSLSVHDYIKNKFTE